MSEPIRVFVEHDDSPENPSDYSGWKVFSFSNRHRNFTHPDKLGLGALGPDNKPIVHNPGLRRKMDVGLAFLLSYYEHGPCQWSLMGHGPQCRFDSVRIAGLLVWGQPPQDLGPKTYAEREKDAEQFLQTYTNWCNGWVYGYRFDDPSNKIDASCYGFYDLDQMFREIAEAAGGHELVFDGQCRDLVEYHWPVKAA